MTASIGAVIRAIDKEFSLSSNYPKGHGELFREWVCEYYPGILLLHGILPVYMNYPYYIEFLVSALRKPRKMKNESTSILQKNLFVVLTSSEMIALV